MREVPAGGTPGSAAPAVTVGLAILGQDEADLLAVARRAAGWAGMLELPSGYPFHRPEPATVRELRALAQSTGVRYAVHGPMMGVDLGALLPGIRRAAVAEVCRAIVYARQLGAAVVTIHPAFAPPTPGTQRFASEIRRAERRSLRRLRVFARAAGVAVALENMPRTPAFRPTSADLSDLVAALTALPGPGFGATFDVGHAHQAGLDPAEAVGALTGRLRHVHASDNDGVRDAHLPIGRGTVDWPRVAASLAALGYAGGVVVEPNPRWTEGEMRTSVADLEALLRAGAVAPRRSAPGVQLTV
jgi:sugar phosphate isomerase/epimerase